MHWKVLIVGSDTYEAHTNNTDDTSSKLSVLIDVVSLFFLTPQEYTDLLPFPQSFRCLKPEMKSTKPLLFSRPLSLHRIPLHQFFVALNG